MQPFLARIKESVLARAANIQIPLTLQPNERPFASLFQEFGVIAEIKLASPSRGRIYQGPLDPLAIAGDYIAHGARALSILTEPQFFQGSVGILRAVRKAYPEIPILLKDFVLKPIQIAQALDCGANAVLLIVAFLSKQELKGLYDYALRLGLTPLIEVHDEAELAQALSLEPDLIGINHRDLKTLKTDLEISTSLMQKIPEGVRVIAESGIESSEGLQRMKNRGFHGCLIGSHCMQSVYPGQALGKLLEDAHAY